MVHAHPLKGVVGDGAHIHAVDHHVFDLIAFRGGDVEGLARTLLDQGLAAGRDGAVFARGGRHDCVIGHLIGIQHHIVDGQAGAVLAGVDEGKADILAVLILFGDGHLGLRFGPGGEQTGISLEVPNLLPVCTVVGNHHLQIAVLVLHGVPVGGVEVKDHVGFRLHRAQIGSSGIQPLVLLVHCIIVDGSGIVLVTVPGVGGAALGFHTPVIRQPLLVEVLRPENVGGNHVGVVVGIAGNADRILLGVAGIVVDDHAKALAHAGDVIFLDMRSDTGLVLRKALAAVKQAGVLEIVEDDGGHILVVADIQIQIVTALGFLDLQILGLGFLRIDGDGELPEVLFVVGGMIRKGQGGLNADGGLGVVGQGGAMSIRAVPGRNAVILGVDSSRDDLIIIVAVDGFADIFAILGVVHRAVLAGDGVGQVLGIAQQAGIDAGQTVHKVVIVGGNGVAVCQIRLIEIVVVAQIGVNGILAGGAEGGVHIRLCFVGGAVQSLPVVGGVHDWGLGPVAIESEEGDNQIDGVGQRGTGGIHLLQGDPALDVAAVCKGVQLGRIGQCDGDTHVRGFSRGNCNAVIGAVGGKGMRQQNGGFGGGHERLARAVGVGFGIIRNDNGGNVIVKSFGSGIMYRELHGVCAVFFGVVLQLQLGTKLAGHRDVTLGVHGVAYAHQAGALLARGIGNAVIVGDDVRRAHQQRIRQMLALCGGQLRIVFLQSLLHNGHTTGDMGRGHGGAVHVFIGIARDSGINAGAGSGDLRLQSQLRGAAPGGEVRHAIGGSLHEGIRGSNRQCLGLLLLHIFACRLRDKGAGDFPVRNGHVQHAGGIVVYQHTDGTGCRRVAQLLFIVQTAAALYQSDLAGQVQTLIVLFGAVIGDGHVLQNALGGQSTEGNGTVILADQRAVLIGQLLLTDRNIGAVDYAVGNGGNGKGFAIGGGFADKAVIGIGGQRLAAESVAVGRAVSVAGSDRQGHAAFAYPLEDGQKVFGPLVLGVIVDIAAVGAKAQVGHIGAQQDAVLQRAQNIRIGSAAGAFEHVHVEDLRLGRDTHDGVVDAGIARSGGGDMRAVVALCAGRAVFVLVAVVKLEGDLCAVVQVGNAQTADNIFCLEIVLFQQALELLLRQGRGLRRLFEDFMGHVHAGIQNCDGHTLAVETGGVVQAAADHLIAVGGGGDQLKGRGQEHGFHAVEFPDLFILTVGYGGGKAVEERRILVLPLHALSVHRFGGDLRGRLILPAQQRADLGPGVGIGRGIVHDNDDLYLVVFIIFGSALYFELPVFFPVAPENLLGDIRGDVVQTGFLHGSQRSAGLSGGVRDSKDCARKGGQNHYQRQYQSTASFECCHPFVSSCFLILPKAVLRGYRSKILHSL